MFDNPDEQKKTTTTTNINNNKKQVKKQKGDANPCKFNDHIAHASSVSFIDFNVIYVRLVFIPPPAQGIIFIKRSYSQCF